MAPCFRMPALMDIVSVSTCRHAHASLNSSVMLMHAPQEG